MFKLSDRVKQTSITQGTGIVSLYDTFNGFQSFANSIGEGNTTYYTIENGSNFEVGVGTYSNNTLSRDLILDSSNNKQKISLNGVSIVFCSYPAERSFFLNEQGYASGLSPYYSGIAFPDGSIQYKAASADNYRNITSSSSILITDDIIFVDTTSNNIIITMPTAVNNGGKKIIIKQKYGNNNFTISTINNQTIDGSSTISIPYSYQSLTLVSDNTNWYII